MAKTPQDVIGSKLLEVYNSNLDKRQAQIDLERAMAHEQHVGRTAVGGVFAELQQLKEKEQAKQQKIKEQGQQAAPPPSSMVPPLTEVTGQTQGRSAAGALKAAGDIAATVLGGRGVKTSGLPGSTGGINPGAAPPGTNQPAGRGTAPLMAGGISGPLLAAAAQVPAAAGYPPVSGVPGQPLPLAAPAAAQPTGQLSTTQRVIRGLGAAGAIALRQPGLATSLSEDAITGNDPNAPLPPTPEQQAALNATQAQRFAPGLAGLLTQIENAKDPITQRALQSTYDSYLKKIAEAGGPNGQAIADTADLLAFDTRMQQVGEQELKKQDPLYRQRLQVADAVDALGDKSPDQALKDHDITDAQYYLLKVVAPKGTTSVINNLPPAVQTQLYKNVSMQNDLLDQFDTIEQNYDPGFLDFKGRAERMGLTVQDYFNSLSPEDQAKYEKFNAFDRAVGMLTLSQVSAWAGKTMSEHEIALVMVAINNANQSPARFKTYMAEAREQVSLAKFRTMYVLDSGKDKDPRTAFTIGSARNLALDTAATRVKQLTAAGMSDGDATQQVDMEFWNQYGMDLKRLQDKGYNLPPSLQTEKP